MAWPEPMYDKNGKIKGYRGRYRDAKGDKQKVLDPNGQLFKRPKAAKDAATAKEVTARRSSVADKAAHAPDITWAELWDIVSASRVFDSDTATTEASIVKNFLIPKWGNESVNEITKKIVQAWVNALAAGTAEEWLAAPIGKGRPRPPRPSASYVRKIWSPFAVSFRLAMDMDPPILDTSPCVGIKLPRVPRKQKQYIPMAQADQLGEQLKPHYRDVVDFGLEVGLRPGELCGFHVDQVDRDSRELWVTNVLLTQRRLIRSWPKDDDARRIPLTQKALDIIDRQIRGRDMTSGCGVAHLDGTECDGALVFVVPPRNVAMNPRTLGQRMHDAAEKAGLPKRSPYAIRRGYATRLARGGVDAFELADVLGHEDIKLVREYVQQTPGARQRLLAALGEPQQLTVVDGGGAHGASSGATPDGDPVGDSGIDAGKNAG